MAMQFSQTDPGTAPAKALCHGSAGCPRWAIGWVKMPGPNRMWIPVCGRCVGPWTIQGARYLGPVEARP